MTDWNNTILQCLQLDPAKTRFQVWPVGEVPESVKRSFDELPADAYLDAPRAYRFRSYGCGEVEDGRFSYLGAPPFIQDPRYNVFKGGVHRTFGPLSSQVKRYLETTLLKKIFLPILPPAPGYDVGIHQIRVIAGPSLVGLPAPEGVHQDGFDFVSILMVGVENGMGAKCMLYDLQDNERIVLEATIPENTLFIFNDRTYKHYTTALTPMRSGPARRDVFIFTISRRMLHGQAV
ncbi:2OG-Fe dioxygenase family protein [Geothrix sp. 21YS21S-2]|uniref:2OG-Fe dioxygenase family protein n=1 Tax=Geothrix sp. 21YS21S-2 TaxID=3068893 RepID=UPI0027BAF7CF|nr:2OG-Fe dioxygenase family protein [Geothrix sp. 21YS21S-2]